MVKSGYNYPKSGFKNENPRHVKKLPTHYEVTNYYGVKQVRRITTRKPNKVNN